MSARVLILASVAMVVAILAVGIIVSANAPSAASVPSGRAYLDGQEIYFMHTEVSDADVAKALSGMMNSPVIHVPALTQVPASALADVYVFKNGVKGMGPLGFQADIFDNPPGTSGYSPLRRLVFVTWKDGTGTRELKSLAELRAAEGRGEVTIEQTKIVINMPFVTWPGGKR